MNEREKNFKILITGPPGSGKSTLIIRLISFLTERGQKIKGFLTPEVRISNKRIGFNLEDIETKQQLTLARVGGKSTKYRVGRYNVFLENLDNYIEKLKIDEKESTDVFIIDEIGKMELLSKKFRVFLKNVFISEYNVIATIGLNVKHSIQEIISKIQDIQYYTLNINNRREIFNRITSYLEVWLKGKRIK